MVAWQTIHQGCQKCEAFHTIPSFITSIPTEVFATLTSFYTSLSLALSRKGREEVLFECIERFLSGR